VKPFGAGVSDTYEIGEIIVLPAAAIIPPNTARALPLNINCKQTKVIPERNVVDSAL
jgi:hypothetical protein